MPKMFKLPIYLMISFLLFIPFIAFAQQPFLKTEIVAEQNATHSFTMVIRFKADSRIANGFVLSFSTNEQVFPNKILVDGKNFWLHQSQKIPVKKNVVSWSYQNSALQLRFKPGEIKSGAQLALYLHLNELLRNQKEISMDLAALNGFGKNGIILSHSTIPLPQHPQNK